MELLAEQLGLGLWLASRGGTNFAVGGARITGGRHDLADQLAALLTRADCELNPLALYVVYAGGNDLLVAMAALRPRGGGRAYHGGPRRHNRAAG